MTELAVESAQGAIVTDVDGNRLLDFAGGIGVLAAGHCPPEVVAAIKTQADQLLHVCAIVASYEPMVALAEALNAITPGDFPKKTLLMNSGAEAVESAVNVARSATGRAGLLVFEGAYHGRTNMTLSMTSKYALFKKGFGPFAPEVYRIPFPNVLRRPPGTDPEQFVGWSIKRLEEAMISQVDPSALAAIVIEPVQGEGGFVPAPAPFLAAIRRICDQHGIVMIVDEVQAGFGRTGRMFSIEHSDVVPDIVVMAKSLGSGLPISAITGRAELLDVPHPGGLGGTYSGNPIACVAALETVKLISSPAFLARAQAIGVRLRAGLEALQQNYECIADVRGLGPMLAIELVKDAHLTPDPDLTLAVTKATLNRGLITIRAGLFSNCVRFLPPLTITDDQIDEALAVLAKFSLTWGSERPMTVRPPIRILDASGSPEQIGKTHGAAYAEEIRRYTDDRVGLVASGLWSGGPISRTEVLAIAESMLGAHEAFDPDLFVELCAMADAAGITPAEAVVVGGFTDFVDTVRAVVGGTAPETVIEDDCTATIVPDHRANGAGFFGQTWDMHDTATDHVVLLRLRPDDAPASLVFTTTGCLGQIGMNSEGVCVGINNLVGVDGTRGVTWPSVVRSMLTTSTADEALDVLMGSNLAGAHNFMIFDRHGNGHNVEAMPSARVVTTLGAEPLVHTNHTLAPETTALQGDKSPGLMASSTNRLNKAAELLAVGTIDEQRLFELTREPEAICQTATAPYYVESSGAAVMRPATGDFWACWGRPAENLYQHITFEPYAESDTN